MRGRATSSATSPPNIRFWCDGGPNAGHKVYAEPEPEAYFHLPSGTERAPKAQLLLGAGAVIYPSKLLQEIATHQVDAERVASENSIHLIGRPWRIRT